MSGGPDEPSAREKPACCKSSISSAAVHAGVVASQDLAEQFFLAIVQLPHQCRRGEVVAPQIDDDFPARAAKSGHELVLGHFQAAFAAGQLPAFEVRLIRINENSIDIKNHGLRRRHRGLHPSMYR